MTDQRPDERRRGESEPVGGTGHATSPASVDPESTATARTTKVIVLIAALVAIFGAVSFAPLKRSVTWRALDESGATNSGASRFIWNEPLGLIEETRTFGDTLHLRASITDWSLLGAVVQMHEECWTRPRLDAALDEVAARTGGPAATERWPAAMRDYWLERFRAPGCPAGAPSS